MIKKIHSILFFGCKQFYLWNWQLHYLLIKYLMTDNFEYTMPPSWIIFETSNPLVFTDNLTSPLWTSKIVSWTFISVFKLTLGPMENGSNASYISWRLFSAFKPKLRSKSDILLKFFVFCLESNVDDFFFLLEDEVELLWKLEMIKTVDKIDSNNHILMNIIFRNIILFWIMKPNA